MAWTQYLPDSPDTLARWEFRVWMIAAVCGGLAILLGFVARDISRHRGAILQARFDDAITDAKAKAEALEAKQRPRVITKQQGERVLAELSSAPKGEVNLAAPFNNGEAEALARQIIDLLERAGWTAGLGGHSGFGLPAGLTVVAKNWEKPPARAIALHRALESIGLTPQKISNPHQSEDSVGLIVERKP